MWALCTDCDTLPRSMNRRLPEGRSMMKPLLWLLVCAPALLAVPVDKPQADQVAANALAQLPEVRELIPEQVRELDAGWLYALLPRGYLVVSANTELPPVPAWSLSADVSQWAEGDNLLVELLNADLSSRLAHLEQLPERTRNERAAKWERLTSGCRFDGERVDYWPNPDSSSTGGWVDVNWGQGSPYNQLVPTSSSGVRSLAGCPSVAMAQILELHASTRDTRFDSSDRYHHNYGGNDYWIDDDADAFGFPSFPELNVLLDSLDARWTDGRPRENRDIAALIFACGVACHQVYHPQGSGTFSVSQAYAAWQRFGYEDCRLLEDDVEETWSALRQNMMEGHPAHLAVVTPAWDAGHNVVVDGYNSEGYFHINFGWTGSYDGWYLLPDELPYNLSVLEGVIVDLLPATVDVPASLPRSVDLELACYPNPANPGINVCVQMPASQSLEIKVFNLLGQEVGCLYHGGWPGGSRTLYWQPTGAGGCYLIRAHSQEGASVCSRVTVIP